MFFTLKKKSILYSKDQLPFKTIMAFVLLSHHYFTW